MRKILLFVVACMMVACSTTPEERAERLVTDYIKSGTNDPSIVQDVDIGMLVDKPEHDLHGNTVHYWYAVITYRAKNAYGALIKSDYITVKFNNDVTEIICYDCFR